MIYDIESNPAGEFPLDSNAANEPEFVPAPQPDNTLTHEAFTVAIAARLEELLGATEIARDYLEQLKRAFPAEIDAVIMKFAAGQQKHGGDIRDRDLLEEATQESRDLMHYLLAMRILRSCPPTIDISA